MSGRLSGKLCRERERKKRKREKMVMVKDSTVIGDDEVDEGKRRRERRGKVLG